MNFRLPLLLSATVLLATACEEPPQHKQWATSGPLAPEPTREIPPYAPDSRFVKEAPAPKVEEAPKVPEGELLFAKSGCAGCHAQGAPFYEKLAGAKGKSVETVAAWILNPKAVKPDTIMPPYANSLSEAQARALAEWVLAGNPGAPQKRAAR